MVLVTLLNGTSLLNVLLIPAYALVMLAGLQMRDDWMRKGFSVLVLIEFIGAIVMLFIRSDSGNGSFIDPANYNIATALTLIVFLLSYDKWKWMLLPFAIVGVFLTSAEEASIYVAVLLITFIVRRDWSKKLIPTGLAVLVCIILFFGFHQPRYMYMVANNQWAVIHGQQMPYQTDPTGDVSRGRMDGYKLAITTPSILGHGFVSTWDTPDTVHNIPLRVLYDLGFIGLFGFILAMIGWMRRSTVYINTLIIAMMVFDHFLWTQAGLWFWVMIGLTYNVSDTYIFKSVRNIDKE